MNKKLLQLFSLVTLLAVACCCAVFAGSQDFTLVNETGMDIYEIYVSPSNSNDWEEDVLDDEILRDGEELDIEFSGTKEKYWDIMVKDKQKNEYVWEDLNLKEISEVTIYRDGKKLWAEWK